MKADFKLHTTLKNRNEYENLLKSAFIDDRINLSIENIFAWISFLKSDKTPYCEVTACYLARTGDVAFRFDISFSGIDAKTKKEITDTIIKRISDASEIDIETLEGASIGDSVNEIHQPSSLSSSSISAYPDYSSSSLSSNTYKYRHRYRNLPSPFLHVILGLMSFDISVITLFCPVYREASLWFLILGLNSCSCMQAAFGLSIGGRWKAALITPSIILTVVAIALAVVMAIIAISTSQMARTNEPVLVASLGLLLPLGLLSPFGLIGLFKMRY